MSEGITEAIEAESAEPSWEGDLLPAEDKKLNLDLALIGLKSESEKQGNAMSTTCQRITEFSGAGLRKPSTGDF